jgi:hypothetical protein
MERETGIEPATFSLGNWTPIENTLFSVDGIGSWRIETTDFQPVSGLSSLMEY